MSHKYALINTNTEQWEFVEFKYEVNPLKDPFIH